MEKSQKCVFRLFPSLAHGGSLCAPLTSLAARRKSRFAEKKSASPKKNFAYGLPDSIVCIKGVYPYLWILATTDPLRLSGGMKANSVGSLKLDNKVKGMMDISLQKERLTSEGKAQAEVVVTVRRVVVVTKRHAAEPRAAEPATATEHAGRPTIRTCRIVLRRTAITAFPITTPFTHVATHIVDAQLVGRLGGNGVGC